MHATSRVTSFINTCSGHPGVQVSVDKFCVLIEKSQTMMWKLLAAILRSQSAR